MTRDELKTMSQAKLEDASLLLSSRRASNAYYLAGYAVGSALKACIAKQISANTIPDKSFALNISTHEFSKLVGVAGLTAEFKKQMMQSPGFAVNWTVAAEWLPDARYRPYSLFEAQVLIEAIGDPQDGVLRWIRRFW